MRPKLAVCCCALMVLGLGGNAVAAGARKPAAAAAKKPAPARARTAAAPRALSPTAQAKAYAKEFGFKPRTITVGPAARKVKRVFVPMTPDSYQAFTKYFNKGSGYCYLPWVGTHISMGFAAPNKNTKADQLADCYLWGLNHNGGAGAGGDYRNMYAHHSPGGGRTLAVKLDKQHLDHLYKWVGAPKGKRRDGHCMYWLPNAEVAKGTPLFHHLGLTRSKDGPQMLAKLLHAADNKVAVVGVCVNDAAEFAKMSKEQLLGPVPKAGVEDSVK